MATAGRDAGGGGCWPGGLDMMSFPMLTFAEGFPFGRCWVDTVTRGLLLPLLLLSLLSLLDWLESSESDDDDEELLLDITLPRILRGLKINMIWGERFLKTSWTLHMQIDPSNFLSRRTQPTPPQVLAVR